MVFISLQQKHFRFMLHVTSYQIFLLLHSFAILIHFRLRFLYHVLVLVLTIVLPTLPLPSFPTPTRLIRHSWSPQLHWAYWVRIWTDWAAWELIVILAHHLCSPTSLISMRLAAGLDLIGLLLLLNQPLYHDHSQLLLGANLLN